MARVSWSILAAVAAAGCVLAQTSPRARYEISGTVVDHRTQTPLGSVMVSITPTLTGRNESLSVATAPDGSFHFVDLGPGKYALSAERHGQQQQQFHSHGQFSTAVATGPGIDSQHIVFPLFADARLSGTVLDDDGDSVAGAQVLLLRKNIFDGKSRVNLLTQTRTTTLGAFHFGHLRPGIYYLAVTARPWYAGANRYISHQQPDGSVATELVPPPAALDHSYPITYTGDTANPAAAQPVNITEGSSISAPINLHAVASLHVVIPEMETAQPAMNRGRVLPPPAEGGFRLTAAGPDGVEIPAEMMFAVRTGGEQEITIAPGTYRVSHHVSGPNGQAVRTDGVMNATANGPATISNVPSTSISGHLVNSGSTAGSNVILQIIGDRHGMGTMVQSDGSFAFPQSLEPGRYRLVLMGEADLSVQAISDGKHTTSGNALVIPPHALGTMEISVTTGPTIASTFNGVAVRVGKPVAGAMVLLLPENLVEAVAIGRDQSDSDGTFSILNVQPGRYTLLAFDCDSDDASCGIEYRDPAVMKPYLAQGKSVTVPGGSKDPIEVTVISPANDRIE